MQSRRSPSSPLRTNKIGAPVGLLDSLIHPFRKLSSRYSRRTFNSFSERLYIGPYGGSAVISMACSGRPLGGNLSASSSEKTSRYSSYSGGNWGSSDFFGQYRPSQLLK